YTVANGLVMVLVCLFALREFQSEMTQVFLPFFADDILGSGAMGFGYLNGANGVGALIGLFGIASLGNFRYKGWLIIGAGVGAGFMLIAFALSHWLILSVVLLAASGCFATVFENVNRTVLQQTIPDELRGRVMSLREAVRGLFGPWVAYGLGLGGEYIGVATTGALFGVLFVAIICFVALMLPAFRKL
ncbi:MAG: MFS transporter, partial [Desulfobacterales bacterium]|nr:MFS transporter [Desulfobacterales bacterium]